MPLFRLWHLVSRLSVGANICWGHWLRPDISYLNVTIVRTYAHTLFICVYVIFGPRQANLVLIVYASSEGSGETAHPRSLARTFAAGAYKQ